jgi:hypothetical protein
MSFTALRPLPAIAAALLAACGGGGGSAPAPSPQASPAVPITVAGTMTFDSVPAVAGLGLDYSATQPKPARGITVELVSGGTVLASATTDSAGGYSFDVPQSQDVVLRVRAEMIRVGAPSWSFTVVDNLQADTLYTLESGTFNTGTAASIRNLHAASGWDGSHYGAARAAAPFAILDTVYDAVQLVLTAAPALSFPPLVLHWSTANASTLGASGAPDVDTGEIGTSFFRTGLGIYLLGAEDDDTDEYDRHVVAHEWGHYFESVFSRSDSIGGPHTRHDQLDLRVAFGEGWGNAFSAMVTGESVYRDSFGPRQAKTFAFDVEGPVPAAPGNRNPGWYSEESVQEILYDLYDSHVDLIRNTLVADNVALGFAPLYDALVGPQRNSVALTSIFPLIDALRDGRPADAPLIDAIVTAQNIAPVTDAYGSAETHFGDPSSQDLQSVYDELAVNGPAVQVCSLDDYSSAFTGSINKLGSRRFIRFAVAAPGPHTVTARALGPLNGKADPDMILHRVDQITLSSGAPAGTCSESVPADCVETFSPSLEAGEYVLEVYEWSNTNDASDTYPPIGRTCFDVTVTQP